MSDGNAYGNRKNVYVSRENLTFWNWLDTYAQHGRSSVSIELVKLIELRKRAEYLKELNKRGELSDETLATGLADLLR